MKDSGYEAILYYACNLQLIIQYHWALQESTNAVAYPEISTAEWLTGNPSTVEVSSGLSKRGAMA